MFGILRVEIVCFSYFWAHWERFAQFAVSLLANISFRELVVSIDSWILVGSFDNFPIVFLDYKEIFICNIHVINDSAI